MNADDRLRRLRDDERWTDDAPPRPTVQRVVAADRRRRRLVPALATAVTAALVVVVGATVLLHGRTGPAATGPSTSPTNAAVIPWVATTPVPTPTATDPTVFGPRCEASGLDVESRPGETAMGAWRQAVTITNRGDSACELVASELELQAYSEGRFVPVGETRVEDPSGRYRLEPGRSAHFWGSFSPCVRHAHPHPGLGPRPRQDQLVARRQRRRDVPPHHRIGVNPSGPAGPAPPIAP